ncbi:MAG: serine/threonine protein kinase [Deltaproteobacteria bacterium]|nr:serine/threonine protein kinase [Deltaproteobacteria bacterium]
MTDGAARADDALVGKTLRDCYRVIRRIGEGGMGAVYEAEHTRIGRRVAIKCLHPQHAQNADIVRRFHREAQAAARIGNEHIVEVTDMGELPDGSPFFVLELLTGQSLSDLVRQGPLPIGRAVRVAEQICDALEAAHVAGIVHRDLKPENVFLVRKSRDPDFVKVLDFGISRFREAAERVGGASTAAGSTLGTPYYMSPEQAHGLKDIDARVDVWAMGVILYQLLTGRLPFEAETYPLLVLKIVSEQPSPIAAFRNDVPAALDAIVLRAMAKPRDERFPSMAALAQVLAPYRGLDDSPEMRVPLAGAALGAASSTPSLGGMSAMLDSGRGPLEGSGARPSFGVMPTPAPTSSVASSAAPPGVGARAILALLVGGVLLATLIGVGTFTVLSTTARGPARAPEPVAHPVSATAPIPSPPAPTAAPVAARPAALPVPAPTPASPPAGTAPVASAPVAPAAPALPEVVVPSDPRPAGADRTPTSRRRPGTSAPPAPVPTAVVPRPLAGPPPRPPSAPVATPRILSAPPPPRPAPPAPARPPVYVGPSRTDTTGLRPDPY